MGGQPTSRIILPSSILAANIEVGMCTRSRASYEFVKVTTKVKDDIGRRAAEHV